MADTLVNGFQVLMSKYKWDTIVANSTIPSMFLIIFLQCESFGIEHVVRLKRYLHFTWSNAFVKTNSNIFQYRMFWLCLNRISTSIRDRVFVFPQQYANFSWNWRFRLWNFIALFRMFHFRSSLVSLLAFKLWKWWNDIDIEFCS